MMTNILMVITVLAKSYLGKITVAAFVVAGITSTALEHHSEERKTERLAMAKKKDFMKRVKSYGDELVNKKGA